MDELENIVEKWCYFFKYASETSEADMKKIVEGDDVIEYAYEALNQFNWNEQELLSYEQEIKRVLDNYNAELYIIEKAQKEGMEKGIAKGMEKEKLENAKRMIALGISLETIAKAVDLPLEQVKKISTNLE